MSETVKKRREIYDVNNPLYCVWLQEMAERGFILETSGFFRDTFKIEKPQKRLYRMIGKSCDSMSDEEKVLYEEAGWERVFTTSGNITILTNRDVNAMEIYSDRDSYAKTIRGKWIGSIFMITMFCFWTFRSGSALADLLSGGEYAKKYGYWHGLDGEPLLLDFILLILGTLTIVYGVTQIIKLTKLAKSEYRKELPNFEIAYNDPVYLKAKRTELISDRIALSMFMCLALSLICYIIYESGGIKSGTDALSYSGEHPVMLREVDPASWYELLPLIENGNEEDSEADNEENGKSYYIADYMAGDESGGIFRESYREQIQKDKAYRHFADTGDDEDYTTEYMMEAHYLSEYKAARNEKIAEEYLAEAIAYELYRKADKDAQIKALDAAKTDMEGVDYAGYIEKDGYVSPNIIDWDPNDSVANAVLKDEYVEFPDGRKEQKLYLRKGNVIEIIEYYGPIDIRDKMELFVDEIQ